ncbi:MAG: hypothetical protein CNIPEHKO_00871 [Anaerolineales bacterium]|nr:hypothetical protein [Anaerolineales bacterium]
MTLDLKLDLPENVFKEAKEAGLLQPAEIERLLREELRRRRVDELFVTADKLAALELLPLTEEELEAEIAAARETRSK